MLTENPAVTKEPKAPAAKYSSLVFAQPIMSPVLAHKLTRILGGCHHDQLVSENCNLLHLKRWRQSSNAESGGDLTPDQAARPRYEVLHFTAVRQLVAWLALVTTAMGCWLDSCIAHISACCNLLQPSRRSIKGRPKPLLACADRLFSNDHAVGR